jgi:hypothetical protein
MTAVVWEAERVDWSPVPSTFNGWEIRLHRETPWRRYSHGAASPGMRRAVACDLGIEEGEVTEVLRFARQVARESGMPVLARGAGGQQLHIAYNPGPDRISGKRREYAITRRVTEEP